MRARRLRRRGEWGQLGTAADAPWANIVGSMSQLAADMAEDAAISAYVGAVDGGGVAVAAEVGGELGGVSAAGPWGWLIAIVALGTVMASPWIIRGLGKILSILPLIGGAVEGAFDGAASWWQNTLYGWLGGVISPIVHLFQAIGFALFSFPSIANSWLRALTTTVLNIEQNVIPQQASNAFDYAQQQVQGLQAQQAADEAKVQADFQAAIRTSVQYAHDAAQGVYGLEQIDVGHLQHNINDVHDTLLAHETEIQRELEVDIQQQVSAAETKAHNEVQQAEGKAHAELGAAVLTLTATMNALNRGLQTQLNALRSQVTTDEKTCLDPMCETVGKDATQLLNLLQIGGLGALFAFLAAAVKEPQPTAAVTVTVLEPIIGEGIGGLVDLVAVHV